MRASENVPTFAACLEDLRDRFECAPGVLCCLDFDGTLAPIVDDPGDATMDGRCQSLVGDLAALDSVRVAVVSGRAIDDLRDRVGLDVTYAGNHGLELRRGDRTEIHPDAAEQAALIDEVCANIADETDDVPGCRVENKGVTATAHYRQVPDEQVSAVVAAVESAAADDELEVLAGRQIREIRPRVDWDKGRAVATLAEDVPDDWETLYVGDDTTDEDAFEVVEPDGIGVVVGQRSDTAASIRAPDRTDVADLLAFVERGQR